MMVVKVEAETGRFCAFVSSHPVGGLGLSKKVFPSVFINQPGALQFLAGTLDLATIN